MAAHVGVTIRTAKREDLEHVASWMQKYGWADDKEELELFLRVYGDDLMVAETTEGEAVGFAAWCILGPSLGMGNNVIVREDMRGRGVGRALILAYKSHLKNRNAWLHADTGRETIYAKFGFVHQGYSFGHFKGILSRQIHAPSGIDEGVTIDDTKENIDKAIVYDERVTSLPDQRGKFLREMVDGNDNQLLVALQARKVVGILIAHSVAGISKIGPFMADTPSIAASLLARLSHILPDDREVEVDTLELHENVRMLMDKFSLKQVNAGMAIYSQHPISFDMNKIYSFSPF